MNLMLLCAGEGTRLRPHTYFMPKPEIPLLTVPMAAYSLEWAREVNPSRLVVNTYHLPRRIHGLFHTLELPAPELRFSDEAPVLMGPGGGIAKARAHLDQASLLVMNGDEVFLPSSSGQLAKIKADHVKSDRLATLVVMNHEGVGKQFGGVWTKGAQVLGFGKTPTEGSEKGWHYIGAAFFSPRIFKFLPTDRPSNILYDALVMALRLGESVSAAPVEGWWHETGNEKDYLAASKSALEVLVNGKGSQAEFLKSVLQRSSPKARWEKSANGLYLSADGLKAEGSAKGFEILGRGSRLTSSPQNENAVLGDGVQASIATNQLLLH